MYCQVLVCIRGIGSFFLSTKMYVLAGINTYLIVYAHIAMMETRLCHDGDTLGFWPWKHRFVVAQHRSDRNKDAVHAQAPSARLDCASIEPAGPSASDTCR